MAAMGEELATFFAPSLRDTPEGIARDVAFLSSNSFVDALLQAAGGLLAVLNQERQVLAANTALLRMLSVDDPESLVGLRPGEMVGCDHAAASPAGCGTTEYCRSCGAAISILGAISTQDDSERKCVLTVLRGGQPLDLCLRVRTRILRLEDRRFVLLYLQDVTAQERLNEVQRTFFHDLKNLFLGLEGTAQLLTLCDDSEREELVANVAKITNRMGAEVNLQQSLASDSVSLPAGHRRPLKVADVIVDVEQMVRNHHAAANKHLEAVPADGALVVFSDAVLLGRVLLNMVINAFEASAVGGSVRLWAERLGDGQVSSVRFKVWNATVMPEDIKLRVFQRHFSTKGEWGRGVGTWSMKLIGEQFLHGKIGFQSVPAQGTTFHLDLPESPAS